MSYIRDTYCIYYSVCCIYMRYIIIYIFCLNCGGVVRDIQKSWRLVSANDMWHAAALAYGPTSSYICILLWTTRRDGILDEYCLTWPPFRLDLRHWYLYKTCFIFIIYQLSPSARRHICLMLYHKLEIFKFPITEIVYLF